MGFKAANTTAHKALKSLWTNLDPHGQDLPLKCPCGGAKGVTAAGVSRDWRFKIGVFRGSPLRPRVHLYEEKVYMEAVGPEDTGFPPFPTSTGKFRAATERYSDDALVVGVKEEFVVR